MIWMIVWQKPPIGVGALCSGSKTCLNWMNVCDIDNFCVIVLQAFYLSHFLHDFNTKGVTLKGRALATKCISELFIVGYLRTVSFTNCWWIFWFKFRSRMQFVQVKWYYFYTSLARTSRPPLFGNDWSGKWILRNSCALAILCFNSLWITYFTTCLKSCKLSVSECIISCKLHQQDMHKGQGVSIYKYCNVCCYQIEMK